MSPRKKPCSLMQLCIKKTHKLIDAACYLIEKKYPEEDQLDECEREAYNLKCQLMTMLPARIFDVLCSERTHSRYRGNPRIQLQALMHPNMTIFRRREVDRSIALHFWISTLSTFRRLVVLDLKFICTDGILKVIGESCPLLEELNIVSREEFCAFLYNALGLITRVSDAGLSCIKNLKRLRILAMDAPSNEHSNRVGRGVSQAGLIMLISELPLLEELRIEACGICSTLVGNDTNIGPLSLRKMKYCIASAEGIRKLIKICPFLTELSISYLSEKNKDAILKQISISELKLNRLDLLFFTYSDSMQQLLTVKGSYLTHFSLWDIHPSLTFDAVLTLGKCCPNLITLCLLSQADWLVIPRFFRRPDKIFSKIRNLIIGNKNFDVDQMLTFFLQCTKNFQRLVLKYNIWLNIDEALLHLLEEGHFRNVNYLWFDSYLEVSKDVVKRIIQQCDKLQTLTVYFNDEFGDVLKYISENNLNLKFGRYPSTRDEII